MSRPNKRRYVSPAPKAEEFRPVGVAPEELRRLVLPLDGLEALRLTDLIGLEQVEAARHMGVSRQTFGRILAAARRVASQALVGGLALRIEATASVEIKAIATAAAMDVPALMRVAVSAHAASLEAAVAPRFGRAPGFLIVDPKTMDFEYVANGVRRGSDKRSRRRCGGAYRQRWRHGPSDRFRRRQSGAGPGPGGNSGCRRARIVDSPRGCGMPRPWRNHTDFAGGRRHVAAPTRHLTEKPS